jgi:two-component system response regulator YesN
MDVNVKKMNNNNFLRFLNSYLLVLFIPILIGSLIYVVALDIVKKEAIISNTSLLQQNVNMLDKSLAEMDSMIMQLGKNEKIKNLMYLKSPVKGNDIYNIMKTRLELPVYSVSNSFVDTFYIYLKDPDIILTPETTYIKKDFFYNRTFKYGDMSENEWHNILFNERHIKSYFPTAPVTINGKTDSMIAYVKSLPYDSPSNIKGVITVFFKEEQIYKPMSEFYRANDGWVCILGENEKNIISNPKDEGFRTIVENLPKEDNGSTELEVDGRNMTVTYITSTYSNWKYIAAMPTEVVMKKVLYIKKITYRITLIMFFIGLIIACFLAYIKNKPWENILNVLKDILENDLYLTKDGNDYIYRSISRLIEYNKTLKHTMQQQIPLLKISFIDRLLKGEFNNIEELYSFSEYAGIKLNGTRYTVAILHSDLYTDKAKWELISELRTQKLIIKRHLDSIVNKKGIVQNIEDDKIAILLNVDLIVSKVTSNEINTQIEYFIEDIFEKIYEEYKINIYFTVGNIYNNLMDVYQSFNEAKEIVAYNRLISTTDKRAIFYSSITKGNEHFIYYPVEVESKLINMVRAGNEHEVKSIVTTIYNENFIKRQLPIEMLNLVISELKSTLIKILDYVNIDNKDELNNVVKRVNKTIESNSTNDFLSNILKEYLVLCNIVEGQKKSHNTDLVESIIKHLDDSYTDPNICLISVAEKFKLNETYLSNFFKEQTGENFSQYLENIRMRDAKNLLSQTTLPVWKIAKKIGYNSSDTFRKAFKRAFNMNPINYRDVNLK